MRVKLTAPKAETEGTNSRAHAPPYPVAAHEVETALEPGEPPSPTDLDVVGPADNHCLADISIHTGARADQVVDALGAHALSFGRHIVLGAGGRKGRPPRAQLLAHEAGHVATAGSGDSSTVRLAVNVDDISDEMNGRAFYLLEPQGTGPDELPVGTRVIVEAWNGTGPLASVTTTRMGVTTKLDVPKLALDAEHTGVTGVRQYRVGLRGQRTAVAAKQKSTDAAEASVTDWQGREAEFAADHQAWADGLVRLEAEFNRRLGLLLKSQQTMSRMVVRETMYNRFDVDISQWVDFYNRQFNPSTPLDPNVVKSILFQESRMGTHGTHLELPPYDWSDETKYPGRARQNLGQAIDSLASQQLLMIKEMAPDIFAKWKLAELEVEMRTTTMNEQAVLTWRHGDLQRAVKEFFTKRDALNRNPMGHTGQDLYEDYAFWIRTSVRWLFAKYLSLPVKSRSWAEAVRAYNGGGTAAKAYRDAVMARVGKTSDLSVGSD